MIAGWDNRWGSQKKMDDTGTKSPPIVDGDKGTLSSPLETGVTAPGESVGLTHAHDGQ